jgi:hypothetical protein
VRVVVPYTQLRPGVEEAIILGGYRPQLEFVGAAPTDYWALVRSLWAEGQTFALVEHDIVVQRHTLAGMERCSSRWCAARYWYQGRPFFAGLGCVVFRAELLAGEPEVVIAAGAMDLAGHGQRHWCSLDYALTTQLSQRGVERCEDHGLVAHVSGGQPAHRCGLGFKKAKL